MLKNLKPICTISPVSRHNILVTTQISLDAIDLSLVLCLLIRNRSLYIQLAKEIFIRRPQCSAERIMELVVLYCINGVVIAALMHCDLFRSIVLPLI